MEILSPIAMLALLTMVLILLTLLWLFRRQGGKKGRFAQYEAQDTVAAWPPQAARILTVSERQGYELLRRAMPGFLVLAQVQLSRFLRVPTRNSYMEWVQRVGLLSADLLLCDSSSRVLAVIDIRTQDESPRSKQRHERMTRVLEAAGIRVLTWYEGNLPALAETRALLAPLFGISPPAAKESASNTHTNSSTNSSTNTYTHRNAQASPLRETASLAQMLAAGDRVHATAVADDPVPSAFLEDYEPETESGRA